MLLKSALLSPFLCFVISTGLFAWQESDPFGPPSDDPFASDPFNSSSKKPAPKKTAKTAVLAADAATDRVKASSPKQQIMAALSDKTSFDFFEQPLTDVVEFIRSKHNINVILDTTNLDLLGISPDDPVTKSVSAITLRSGLRLMLNDLNLNYVIRDEVLLITSAEAAENITTTELYDVSQVVTRYTGKDEFPELFRKIIAPESWTMKDKKGIGEVALMSFGNDQHFLVVKQTLENHQAIANLIKELQNVVQ